MMADLERIANIVHVTEISSRHVWTYLGGSDRVPYDRYCQLVCIRMLGKIPDTITKSVIVRDSIRNIKKVLVVLRKSFHFF